MLNEYYPLTRLRRLNRTSLLPSSWILDKNFALTGHLAQVHSMSKKIFSIFLHAGKGKQEGEKSGMIRNRYNYLSFFLSYLETFVAQSVERKTSNQKNGGTKSGLNSYFFLI